MKVDEAPIIDVRDLSHTYLAGTPLQVQSLQDVKFQVFEGESVGIIGPTGSGKSTLLYHLNGLLRPQRGEVSVNGLSLSDESTDVQKIRRMVGVVFQSPEDQLFERYAGDDVAFGPRNMGLSPIEVRRSVRDAMHMTGLPFSFKDRLTTDLSEGEKRRLALAGVFAMRPRVLVLDEPTASLDPAGRLELIHILQQWRLEKGRAMILVSHNMEDIGELTERIYVLVEGHVVSEGSTRDVFSNGDILYRHGLSIPEPLKVLNVLRDHGYPVSQNKITVDEVAGEIRSILHGAKI